jgi:translocation and assembly module TamB
VSYQARSGAFGSTVTINGSTQLVHDYPTTADVNISNVPIDRLLRVAQRPDIPASGTLSAAAHVSGTISSPQGNADVTVTRANIYNEPIDRLHATVAYLPRAIDLSQFEIVSGPSRIDMSAHYEHPEGNLQQGNARFSVTSSHIDLARIHNLQTMRPGLGGTLDLSANGAATIHEKDPRILFSSLNANLSASGISAEGRNFGDLKLTATTATANRLSFALDSNLADSSIRGSGTADLAGDYPIDAQLTFSNVTWTHLRPLLQTGEGVPTFEAAVDGQATVNGPAMKIARMNGSVG